MNSRTTKRFRKLFRELSPELRQQARIVYKRWQQDPRLPGLRFKRINEDIPPYYSVRVTRDYRVAGEMRGNTMYWDFIGNHAEYEHYLEGLS